jgi:hypothetical protein
VKTANYLSRPVGAAITAGPAYRGDGAVVGAVERSPAANVVLRVGRMVGTVGYAQTEHVVLTVVEARELVRAIAAATGVVEVTS